MDPFEITKRLIAVEKNKFIVALFIIIFGTFSFPIAAVDFD